MKHEKQKVKTPKISFLFATDIVLFTVSLLVLLADVVFHFVGQGLKNPVVFVSLAGLVPVLIGALRALYRRHLTIDLLASIALIFSLLNQEWHSAAFIGLMLVSARLFARYTEGQATNAIKSLLKLRPTKVHLKIDGQIVEEPIEKVKVGDLVLVNAGERVPVDGIIIEGRGEIDQSSLTGESLPITKTIGEKVFSSTLSLGGDFVMETSKVGQDTIFAKILDLVEKSQEAKAPLASFADKFVNIYIFLIVAGSFALYFFTRDLKLILSVLLVTCADDVAVAIPLAFSAAMGTAASWGAIIKGGKFLEGLTEVKAIVLDKTGTITEGRLDVENQGMFEGTSEKDFLALLGAIMAESNHPTARAIMKFVKSKNIELAPVENTYEESGYGIGAKFKGELVFAGRPGFLENKGIKFSEPEFLAFEKEKDLGRSVIVLSQGQKAIGFISLSDTIRPNALHVMREFKNRGIKRIVMLTGDNEKVAKLVAEKVEISEFRANLLPQDKIKFLKEIINPGFKTAMIGDGVNDAPALVLADIGVAMGAIGSEAAIESADIVLMKDDLGTIPHLFDLSRYTVKVIRQDILIWGLSNGLGLLLVFAGVIGPLGAAAFNFLTDFLPLINSMKLFRMHLHGKPSR
jgi:Cd2+/Zn2+-exporting ATPase